MSVINRITIKIAHNKIDNINLITTKVNHAPHLNRALKQETQLEIKVDLSFVQVKSLNFNHFIVQYYVQHLNGVLS
jgi:hypothetical protein